MRSMYVVPFFLALSLACISGKDRPYRSPDAASAIQRDIIAQGDTLVNYCNLIKAAFFYGQKFADKKLGLTENDVRWYNTQWETVFNIPFYQTGITIREFILGARFGEGTNAPFPPSNNYLDAYPDTYYFFHLIKETGMLHSQYFARCPSCVEHSLAKINAYLKVTQLREQIPQLWPGGYIHRRLINSTEADSLLVYIKCLFPDHPLDPKTGIVGTHDSVQCGDTVMVKSFEGIQAEVPGALQYCDLTSTIDTLGPELIRGKTRKRRSVYRVTFLGRPRCGGPDTCHQYFVISG